MIESNDNAEIAVWQLRAQACELLALSFRYPDETLVDAVSSGEWAKAASEIWNGLGLDIPDGWDDGLGEPDIHDVRAEATRLFVGGPKPPACNLYEGFWRAEDDGVQPLMFVNPHSVAVERFCKSCGLGRSSGSNDPLDNLATECELLEYLASLEACIVEPVEGAPSAEEFPGGSAAAAYDTFLDEHFLTFAPRVAEKVGKESHIPLYRSAALLLGSFCAGGSSTAD